MYSFPIVNVESKHCIIKGYFCWALSVYTQTWPLYDPEHGRYERLWGGPWAPEEDTAAASREGWAESAEKEVDGEHGLSLVWAHSYYLDGIYLDGIYVGWVNTVPKNQKQSWGSVIGPCMLHCHPHPTPTWTAKPGVRYLLWLFLVKCVGFNLGVLPSPCLWPTVFSPK